MNWTKYACVVALMVSSLAWAAPGETLPPGVKKVTEVEGVTEYRLANGMQVLLAPDSSKPTTTVNVTYRVGSRMENYGETGMAHLLEHLMFKGTPHHPHITDELTKRGMRPNGTTWFDRTNYFETFAASENNLDWALHMEADRMVHSFIARKDLDSEMTVVRNEMESGENDPASILMDKIMAAAYQWHNYGKSTIGARTDVENVNIAHLQAFYRKYYQPDNATLVVAGSFDPQKTLQLVEATFGKIPRPKRVLEPTYTLDPVQDGERQVTLRRAGDVQYLEAVYHAVAAASPDSAAFEVLAQVLGDTPSGRLHKAMVETGMATSTGSDYFNLDEPGVIYFEADLSKNQDVNAARKVFLETIEDLKSKPVTADELKRARTQLLNAIDTTFDDPERFGIALSTAIANGDWRLFFLNRDRLTRVKLDEVQKMAEDYLLPSNRTLGIFIPTDHPVRAPAPQRVDAETQLQGYHGNPDFASGEAFDASPENIERRTQWTSLPEGTRLALLSKKTRGHTVHAQINLHFGTASALEGKDRIGTFAGSLLDKGAAGMSRSEIQDRFAALKAQVAFGGGATGAHVIIETVRENLPETLALVTKILRHPDFPENEFNQERASELSDIDSGRTDPRAMASNALSRYFNRHPRGDIRYASTFDESEQDVKAVTLEQVKAFYHDFYGASHAEVAIVGDFDPASVTHVLQEGLSGWQSAQPYELVVDDYQAKPGSRIQLNVPDKANAVFLMRDPFALMDSDPDAPALMVANYIYGQGFLNSRLATRIRQQEGLSYGVGSFLRLNDKVPNSFLGGYAIYAPQNRQKLESAFADVTTETLQSGFTAREVDDARSALMKSRDLSRAQDGHLASQLVGLMYDHRTMDFVSQQDQSLRQVTVDQVNAAMRKYVHPDQFVTVVAGSFGTH